MIPSSSTPPATSQPRKPTSRPPKPTHAMPKLRWDRESVRRKRLLMRAKGESRAIFRTISMVALIALFGAFNLLNSFTDQNDYTSMPFGSRLLAATNASDSENDSAVPENLNGTMPEDECVADQPEIGETGSCLLDGCVTTEDNMGIVILYVCGVIYMFIALAIVCDEFFVSLYERRRRYAAHAATDTHTACVFLFPLLTLTLSLPGPRSRGDGQRGPHEPLHGRCRRHADGCRWLCPRALHLPARNFQGV